jgi:transposase InsO family protein
VDLTSVWVAAQRWVYLMAAIDCCAREIVAWHLQASCRAKEAICLIEQAATERAIAPGKLAFGTDNGSAFTARAFKAALDALGIVHRRGCYRDPESRRTSSPWFDKLKERCVWRHEFGTLDQAREVIGAYVTHYHHRPDHRTPREVAATWNDERRLHLPQRPELSTPPGSTSVNGAQTGLPVSRGPTLRRRNGTPPALCRNPGERPSSPPSGRCRNDLVVPPSPFVS